MKNTLLSLFALMICASGCVTTKAALLDPMADRFPAVSPDSVRVFTAESELEVFDYVRVAIIEATGSGEFTSQTGMIEAMRRKAGLLGGNGVLLPLIQEPGAGAKIAGAIFGTGTERKGNAIAIRIFGKKHAGPTGSTGASSEPGATSSDEPPDRTVDDAGNSKQNDEILQNPCENDTLTISPNEVSFACDGRIRIFFQDRGWNDQRLEFNGIEGLSGRLEGPFKGTSTTVEPGKQFYILVSGRTYKATIVAFKKSVTLGLTRR